MNRLRIIIASIFLSIFLLLNLIVNLLSQPLSNSEGGMADGYCNTIYLPTQYKLSSNLQYIPGPNEKEDNNSASNANPIRFNTEYRGGNDEADYFIFPIASTTPMTIQVTNHVVSGGQLLLYKNTTSNLITRVYTPPTHIITLTNATPGNYIATVHTDISMTYSTDVSYTLQVSIPEPRLPKVYKIEFPHQYIVSNNKALSQTTQVRTLIPPGTYKITLASSDDHLNAQEQFHERWYLKLLDENEKPIISSGSITDLGSTSNCLFEIVNNRLELSHTATLAIGVHTAYPDTQPNSVYPEFAILEEIP